MRVQGWKAVQREIWAWAMKNFGARVPGRWRREPDARGVSEMTVFGLLVEETGEVMRCVVKREQGIRGSAEHWTAELRKELGDVGISLMNCASYEGWDLEELIAERWETISKRNWAEDAYGGGGHR